MTNVSCYNLHERLMPHLRAETAKRLAERGLRQGRIAEHLGVSQAMVSKYLRLRTAPPAGAGADWVQRVVDRAVARALDEEAKGRLPPWCPLCPQLGPAGPGRGEIASEECLRTDQPPRPDESLTVLENLRAAARRLQGKSWARLAPEVNVNIAMAVAGAHDARGVAAFPGRIPDVRGELRPVAEPEFGASNHLSEILLRARRSAPRWAAVLCLRDDDDVRRALKAANLRSRVLRRSRGDLLIPPAPGEPADALIDPGAFGIEPITYLFGETAVDAVEKAERLLAALAPQRAAP